MLASSGMVTVDVTELDPVLGTTGTGLTVTVITGSSAGAVESVNDQTGVVVLTASDIASTATGGIAATTVQAALGELDTEKASTGHNHSGTYEPAGATVAHSADTTGVHGIADTADLVLTDDARLADARTPTPHAATHEDGGADEITLAQSQVTGLTAALAAKLAAADLPASVLALSLTDFPAGLARDSEVAAAINALGLGTAAQAATGDFDPAGAAAAAQAASQPLDSDLTALAALSTTAFGRALLELANAAALRSTAGLVLGTDIYSKAAVDSGFQPIDSDLTAIAALTTTSFGRGLLALADAAALRTAAALGTAAVEDVGTASGDVALLGTGGRFDIARLASGTPDGTKFVRDDGTLAVPAGGGAMPIASQQRTAGNVTLGTSLAAVDTGLDLTLAAVAGDRIGLNISGFLDSAAGYAILNMVTMVSGTQTNFVHDGGAAMDDGVPAWFSHASAIVSVSGEFLYTVQAGDISGGNVTFRLMAQTQSGTRTLRANSTDPLKVWAKNYLQ